MCKEVTLTGTNGPQFQTDRRRVGGHDIVTHSLLDMAAKGPPPQTMRRMAPNQHHAVINGEHFPKVKMHGSGEIPQVLRLTHLIQNMADVRRHGCLYLALIKLNEEHPVLLEWQQGLNEPFVKHWLLAPPSAAFLEKAAKSAEANNDQAGADALRALVGWINSIPLAPEVDVENPFDCSPTPPTAPPPPPEDLFYF